MMIFRSTFLIASLLLASLGLPVVSRAQAPKKAAVFKENKAPTLNLIRRSDESYELWEEFMLMQKANNGDPNAQHELGIRYLLGKGFGVDTVKSAFWIQKAADQDYVIAHYNIGVFLNNGWGVPWNPFKAFEHFQYAAQQEMPEAEYVYGSILTDNLVVPQNWEEAIRWIKKSADAGYVPARDALVDFEKRGVVAHADSTETPSKHLSKKDSSLASSVPLWKPVLLDFSDETASEEDELAFLKEMLRSGSPELKNALGLAKLSADNLAADSTLLRMIEDAADIGSPEALAVLGRFYEKGIIVQKNLMLAATEYLRAIRLEFPRAPTLLWNMLQEKKFLQQVHTLALQGNANAEFVCAGLVSVGFDPQLPPQEAFQLLLKASSQNHVQSLIETGICYYSGRWVEANKEKAAALWMRASLLGSREAQVRLAATSVISETRIENYNILIAELDSASHKGSLLAQVALAHCYETGVGVGRNISEAVHLYRESAYRGSQTAYYALKKMYDELRPDSKKFKISEQ